LFFVGAIWRAGSDLRSHVNLDPRALGADSWTKRLRVTTTGSATRAQAPNCDGMRSWVPDSLKPTLTEVETENETGARLTLAPGWAQDPRMVSEEGGAPQRSDGPSSDISSHAVKVGGVAIGIVVVAEAVFVLILISTNSPQPYGGCGPVDGLFVPALATLAASGFGGAVTLHARKRSTGRHRQWALALGIGVLVVGGIAGVIDLLIAVTIHAFCAVG
jgi:hypothetical protein